MDQIDELRTLVRSIGDGEEFSGKGIRELLLFAFYHYMHQIRALRSKNGFLSVYNSYLGNDDDILTLQKVEDNYLPDAMLKQIEDFSTVQVVTGKDMKHLLELVIDYQLTILEVEKKKEQFFRSLIEYSKKTG